MSGFVIENFTAVVRNTLVGFATVRTPSGTVFNDTSIHVKDGRAWASPASKPILDRNGAQLKDADGKAKWSPVVSFVDKATRDRWSGEVIAALQVAHPEVFG